MLGRPLFSGGGGLSRPRRIGRKQAERQRPLRPWPPFLAGAHIDGGPVLSRFSCAPPVMALTVAQARVFRPLPSVFPALRNSPRCCSACRFCLSVYLPLSPRGMARSPLLPRAIWLMQTTAVQSACRLLTLISLDRRQRFLLVSARRFLAQKFASSRRCVRVSSIEKP